MRIVQLANFYGPTSGGLRTCLDEVGRRYAAAGRQRVLVVPGPADSDEHTPAGRRVTLAAPRLPGGSGYRLLAGRARLLAALDRLEPDTLEVSDRLLLGWAGPWAAARGVPVVLVCHERLDAILAPRAPAWLPLARAADQVNGRLARLAGAVVCPSAFGCAEFARIGVAARRVPLGVDLAAFRPGAPRPGAGRGRLLLTLGRLSREKAPELAVECLRALLADRVPTRLLVVGDGPLRAELGRRAAGLPVRFLGHLDRAGVAHLLRAADALVAPCPVEAFGLAPLEALACGTPVVLPDRGAAPELLAGAAPPAGAVTDGSASGLAAGVRAVLAYPAAERRQAARARAECYSWDATVAGLLAAHAAARGTRVAAPARRRSAA